MKLINCETYRLKEFSGSDFPAYAILSHTWAEEEVTYDDVISPSQGWLRKEGGRKIAKTCEIARSQGLGWAWKSSSAELPEAINSMFTWYERAYVCYVWLSDYYFTHNTSLESMSACKWFTRGWTLQELIAPRMRQFYDQNCTFFGASTRGQFNYSEYTRNLTSELAKITRVSKDVLANAADGLYETLRKYAVCQIMSWAAHRKTSREEDLVYCLLGLFRIAMPLLYGEGRQAFRRLQYEIMREYCDLSILAWIEDSEYSANLVLANSPEAFARSGNIMRYPRQAPEFTVTNRGLKIKATLIPHETQDDGIFLIFPLFCQKNIDRSRHCARRHCAIGLRRLGEDNLYVRFRTDELQYCQPLDSTPRLQSYIYLLTSMGQFV